MIKVRDAKETDLEKIYLLIRKGTKEGVLLKRTKKELLFRIKEKNIVIAEESNFKKIIGVAILDFYSKRLSELRSLYVAKKYRKTGTGKLIVKAVIKKAKQKSVKELLTITTKEMHPWFEKSGFGREAHGFKTALFKKI